jgi:hypothetical protein
MSAPVVGPQASLGRMILHLCRFDLRRFRVLVAVLVGLEVLRAMYVEWALHLAPIDGPTGLRVDAGDAGMTLLDPVVGLGAILLTAIIVQADHPSDDRAFWRARPIPGHVLALAKAALFALVLVVVPVATNTVRLLAYGAPLASVFAATVQIASVFSMIIPIWALAIATRTLPRFLVAVCGLVIGLVVLINLINSLVDVRTGAMMMSTGFSIDWPGETRLGWGPAFAVALAALAVLVAHYRHRRAALSLAAGLVLTAAPMVLPVRTRTTPAPPALAALVAGRLSLPSGLTLPPQSSIDSMRLSGARFPLPLQGDVVTPALPVDVSAGIALNYPRLTVAGRTLTLLGSRQCCRGLGAIGVASRTAVTPTARVAESFGFVPVDEIERLRARHVDVRSDAAVTFVHHRLIAELPLRPGTAFRTERHLVEIVALDPQRSMVVLRVARFPSLTPGMGPQLSFFEADATRQHVATLSGVFRRSALEVGDGGEDWAQGEKWSGRFKLLIQRLGPRPVDPRLLIVESRRIGEAAMILSATDVPVHEAKQP